MCEEIAAEMTRHGRVSFSSAPSMCILGYASAVQPKVSGKLQLTAEETMRHHTLVYFIWMDGCLGGGATGLVLGKTEDAIHPSSNADENVP